MGTETIQAGIALIIVALAGGNIWLLIGLKAAIRSQAKRINSWSEALKKANEVGGSKKVR